ncbi:tRNA (adenosine(37)-N6)-threonylcarbamoyltransferase complex ATPase subunit type 1 TsaE [Sedimenticola thiotaurini]|uniref:tRNA threonylcarbamoyladenosine biosynthesis protein TsaE n=1 Tax=Sedimenticola thiotaurini TaxID=1543721 RepID=A0A0F7JYX1_9GAMM|nr:tRNA (adenosine(37)-N6)-threonylcarbamoyltransferase complex ATPase subunit type 1 TsaE [Sedimenticola thiotaurini]AKH19853.1 hypothetical protein AAY24_05235 [Sedimenticola thiotaurini]
MVRLEASSEQAQERIGERLARVAPARCLIYLTGDLGAGKTTLTRGLLRGLGYRGAVKSPTYTLIEPYEIGDQRCYHLDLYRLADPDEIEYLGLRDMLEEDAIMLVEWPEQGAGALPDPDLMIHIGYLDQGRELTLSAATEQGVRVLKALQQELGEGVKS